MWLLSALGLNRPERDMVINFLCEAVQKASSANPLEYLSFPVVHLETVPAQRMQ